MMFNKLFSKYLIKIISCIHLTVVMHPPMAKNFQMTLPCTYRNQRSSQNSFKDYIQYFIDSITFLRENEWIFNFPNTDVLVHNIFEKFPKGWRYHLEKLSCKELNEIPFGLRQVC